MLQSTKRYQISPTGALDLQVDVWRQIADPEPARIGLNVQLATVPEQVNYDGLGPMEITQTVGQQRPKATGQHH